MSIEQQQVGEEKIQAPQTSSFHFYSIGMVAANKLRGSSVIEVTPIEVTPLLSGELTDNVTEVELAGSDSLGQSYNVKSKMTASIQAHWIPMSDTNRLTAPDVRRGEVVAIYQFGDSDVYHWACLRDMHYLRRLETVTYVFSADPNAPADPKADNCYYLEVSTHDGVVTFRTSKANGEPFAYTMQFNTKEGKVVLTDDIDNYFTIDSEQNLLEMRSSGGSFMQILDKDITINAEGNYTRIVKGNVTETTEGSSSTNTQGPVSNETASSMSNSAASSITNSAPAITEDAGSIALNGTISSGGGSFGGKGDVKMQGDVKIDGVVEADQGAVFGGTVKANQIISEQAVIAPNV